MVDTVSSKFLNYLDLCLYYKQDQYVTKQQTDARGRAGKLVPSTFQ